MKIRSGFVSNSSSSSFVCDCCGEIKSGWDLTYEDSQFCSCEEGHEICQTHVDEESIKTKIKQIQNTTEEDIDEWYFAIPKEECPICNLKTIQDHTILYYIFTKLGYNKNEIIDEIRKDFKDLSELNKYIEEKSIKVEIK